MTALELQLQRIGKEIAEGLGWHVINQNYNIILSGPNELEELCIKFIGHSSSGRLNISGLCVYDGLEYNEYNPSINVSATKSTDKIVTDITRRLLPEYRELLAKTIKKQAENNKTEDQIKANKDMLISLIKDASTSSHSGDIWTPSPYNEVRASSDSVSIGVRYVPMGLAKEIIKLVEKWRAKHGE